MHLFKISNKASVETKNKWCRNIPKRQDKAFDFKTCYVCDAHFEDHFIQKDNVINAELNLVVPRQTWKLTDDAVPTKFFNLGLPRYLEVKSTKLRKPLNRINNSITDTRQPSLITAED